MKNGDRVYISGEVYYGDAWYSVSNYGTIKDIEEHMSLVSIDMIDGDSNAWVYVQNKYIVKEAI